MKKLEGIVWNGLKPDDNIYRTISFERLTELLLQKKNTLVRPSMWKDPFEDLIGQAKVKSAIPGIGRFANANRFYSQCWTLHKASDAIWQIYSDGTDGYRLRTTVRRLLTSLKSQVEYADVRCHIGKVQYKSDKQLIDFGAKHFQESVHSLSEKNAEAFMVKRNAFLHEKEVRLMYHHNHEILEDEGLFQYCIEPNDIFDQIMLHPRITQKAAEGRKTVIEKLGFKGVIKRSLLYKTPSNFVFKLGVN